MPFVFAVSVLLAADVRASVPSLILQAGTFAKIVLIALLVMSIASWGIIWERFRLVRRVQQADRGFLQAFRAGRSLGEVRMLAAQHPHSPLGRLALTGLGELGLTGRGGASFDRPTIEMARRAMERSRVAEMETVEKHLSFLATTGSVAPFLGLMGTVWGVMTAFLNIGVQGSASLIVVAPGIAEALIATIAGLAAAIPAVIGYNYLISRVRTIDNQAASFISEFADAASRDAAEAESPEESPRELRREVGV